MTYHILRELSGQLSSMWSSESIVRIIITVFMRGILKNPERRKISLEITTYYNFFQNLLESPKKKNFNRKCEICVNEIFLSRTSRKWIAKKLLIGEI